MRDSALKSLSTTMAKQNLGPLFLPSKFENFVFMLHLLFLLLLPVLFLSFKFHTYTLLSSHSLCLCKNPLSSMTFSYVVPFTLTKSWILFYIIPPFQNFLFSIQFYAPRYISWQSHWTSALSLSMLLPGYIPFTLSPLLAALNMTPLTFPYHFLSVFSPSSALSFDFSSRHYFIFTLSHVSLYQFTWALGWRVPCLPSVFIPPSVQPMSRLTALHWFSSAIFLNLWRCVPPF